mmetsp:Transcript_15289/g.38890  ORF Transcript_15289/g.38890 Transcript_15289/m.38890 type:complete len:198 (+) Transcript_15289:181-774(+)
MAWQFVTFVGCLGFFHVTEYLLAWVYNRSEVTRDSWLFSKAYCCAMAAAVAEYKVERDCIPKLKECSQWVSLCGLVAVICGEAIRKLAIVTAKSNFTQDIKTHRRPNHRLVTTGIYRHFRHPGYLGWTIWAVGTQVLLVNPVCILAFALLSWRFFSIRIPYEERLLLKLFGRDYETYARNTRIWLPRITESPIIRRG